MATENGEVIRLALAEAERNVLEAEYRLARGEAAEWADDLDRAQASCTAAVARALLAVAAEIRAARLTFEEWNQPQLIVSTPATLDDLQRRLD